MTLPHEHLHVDNRIHTLGEPPLRDLPITEVARADLVTDFRTYANDAWLDGDSDTAAELERYKQAGGRSVVDVTPIGLGRDLAVLRRLAARTGVNIIGSTGYYVARTHPPEVRERTSKQLAETMVRELTSAGPEGARCGAIGEIGISAEPEDDEWKVLGAALEAHRATSAPVWIHITTLRPIRTLLDRLAKHGELERVVICHMDWDIRSLEPQRRALEMGLNVEFDLFGFPAWNSGNWVYSPTDAQRVEALGQLAAEGHSDQLLISHDLCRKVQLRRYGGMGLEHIPRRLPGLLRALGMQESLLQSWLVDNPLRLLAWA